MNDDIRIRTLGAAEPPPAVPALAKVLVDCVEGGASVSFMLPLTPERAAKCSGAAWPKAWRATNACCLVAEDARGLIVGTVQLITGQKPENYHTAPTSLSCWCTGGRRPGHRRARLLAMVTPRRWRTGRHMLVLDTVTGGDAERLCAPRLAARGRGAAHALFPDGRPCGTTFFHKRL